MASQFLLARYDYVLPGAGISLGQEIEIAASHVSHLVNVHSVDVIVSAFWNQLIPGTAQVVWYPTGANLRLALPSKAVAPEKFKIASVNFTLGSSSEGPVNPAPTTVTKNLPTLSPAVLKLIDSNIDAQIQAKKSGIGATENPTTKELVFVVNGQVKKVVSPSSDAKLFDYLHSADVGLLGTKTGCRQGGYVPVVAKNLRGQLFFVRDAPTLAFDASR